MKVMYLPKFLHNYSLSRVALLLFMLVLFAVGAVPSYFSGKWAWVSPPNLVNLNQLRELTKTGLNLSEWETSEPQMVKIGGRNWVQQNIQEGDRFVAGLLLLNQTGSMHQPQVEWMDIDGFWRWKKDSERSLTFEVNPESTPNPDESVEVKARFFRGWTTDQTYAIAQWYSWPTGGNPAPFSWFWRDRLAQLQGNRLPWVAVTAIIPIEPFGEIESVRPLVESLSQNIQSALIEGPFNPLTTRAIPGDS
ncbi:cyanoexosortase B system-associated protein [Oscillatoria sp. HE19RPO]|uniref:cyanoexosortase B system-associated protein n=1 Tax=Oscillatoria sp. HE19RPO TaxID=2954806 RepID=UPI0020C2B2B5|nr:cyanoexosortase B system-associated protein [Oscillatoria sp. HE19RPO]